jgi:CheY-like chemotaxis protein
MIKLWLDDYRLPPDESWTIATTAKEAIAILDSVDVDIVSLDFDLGDEDRCGTGLDVARHLVALTKRGRPMPRVVMLHTQNPVGRERMLAEIAGGGDR